MEREELESKIATMQQNAPRIVAQANRFKAGDRVTIKPGHERDARLAGKVGVVLSNVLKCVVEFTGIPDSEGNLGTVTAPMFQNELDLVNEAGVLIPTSITDGT